MSSRPAPKRRAEKPRRTTRASAPTPPHRSHLAAKSRSRRFPALPSPAIVGATALLVAGAGTAIASSATASDETTRSPSSYATLAANLPQDSLIGPGSRSDVTISRTAQRDNLEAQAELQAQQRTEALAELAKQTQKHAEELASEQWVLPVAGYQISATFGEVSYLWSSMHTGLDFSTPSGTPIVSVARGVVTSTEYDGAYGNKTVVTLEDGTEIWYCHQTSFAASPGETVDPGDLIGYVGSTGNTTGSHLHLEVHPGGGEAVDPYAALVEHGVQP